MLSHVRDTVGLLGRERHLDERPFHGSRVEHQGSLDLFRIDVPFQPGVGLPLREPAGAHATTHSPGLGRAQEWERCPLARSGRKDGGPDAAVPELRANHPEGSVSVVDQEGVVHGDELEVELHDVGPADQVGGARDGVVHGELLVLQESVGEEEEREGLGMRGRKEPDWTDTHAWLITALKEILGPQIVFLLTRLEKHVSNVHALLWETRLSFSTSPFIHAILERRGLLNRVSYNIYVIGDAS